MVLRGCGPLLCCVVVNNLQLGGELFAELVAQRYDIPLVEIVVSINSETPIKVYAFIHS